VSQLSLGGVRYRYAGATAWALDGLDLELEAGEVLGVTGANDAGKSTLCLVGAGLAPGAIGGQLEGTVRVGGDDPRELPPFRIAERCGILFQNAATQLSGTAVTVWEEVAFGPRNLGLDVSAIIDRVGWAMELAGVAELADRRPDRLSGGQAQLVALASVLALRPATLILDEPTSQLDPAGTILVGEALARLGRETGTALLLVEHKTDLLARIADRVAVVAAGRIAILGETDKVLADPRLPSLGVDPPAAVRLGRLATEAGVGAAFAKALAETRALAEGLVAGPASP
jgi:energy-coupling factor transporter ATP-binding protein EcfA2